MLPDTAILLKDGVLDKYKVRIERCYEVISLLIGT